MAHKKKNCPPARALAVLLATLTLPATAADLLIPGQPAALTDGEGLLAIGFELRDEIESLALDQPGALLWTHTFRNLEPGYNLRILRLPAGTYRWRQIITPQYKITFGGERRWAEMIVEAGKLNYAGDFVYEGKPMQQVYVNRANRMSILLAALEAGYPGLLAELELVYHGMVDDPFGAFYRRERQALAIEPAG